MEVYRGIARVRVIARRVAILGLEALETGLRLDERAIDGEMFFGQQALMVCLQYHFIGQRLPNSVLQQTLTILCERRRIKGWLRQIHIQEPAKEQDIVQLFTEDTLAPN
jgi:hypothetical protein